MFLNFGAATAVASPQTVVSDGKRHHVDVTWDTEVGVTPRAGGGGGQSWELGGGQGWELGAASLTASVVPTACREHQLLLTL